MMIMHVQTFDLELSYDFVRVLDGQNMLLRAYTGNAIPQSFRTPLQSMYGIVYTAASVPGDKAPYCS